MLFLHISSSWVKIRLFMENQLPRLSESGIFFSFFFDVTSIICLHISSTWLKIRLYTEYQIPRLPWNALKVPGWVGSYPLSSQAPTHVEVKLDYDNFWGNFADTCVEGRMSDIVHHAQTESGVSGVSKNCLLWPFTPM